MKPLRLIPALGLLVFVSSMLGQAPALVRRSPFAGAAIVGSGPDGPALELGGILSGAGETRYWIYDRASQTGTWAALNEPGLPFLVRAGDPAADSATVDMDGQV